MKYKFKMSQSKVGYTTFNFVQFPKLNDSVDFDNINCLKSIKIKTCHIDDMYIHYMYCKIHFADLDYDDILIIDYCQDGTEIMSEHEFLTLYQTHKQYLEFRNKTEINRQCPFVTSSSNIIDYFDATDSRDRTLVMYSNVTTPDYLTPYVLRTNYLDNFREKCCK